MNLALSYLCNDRGSSSFVLMFFLLLSMSPPSPKSATIVMALDASSHLQPAQGGDITLATKGTPIPRSAKEKLELIKKEPKDEPVVE
jgi:hypothetical protein